MSGATASWSTCSASSTNQVPETTEIGVLIGGNPSRARPNVYAEIPTITITTRMPTVAFHCLVAVTAIEVMIDRFCGGWVDGGGAGTNSGSSSVSMAIDLSWGGGGLVNAGARRAIGVRRIQLWRMSAGTLRLSVRPAGGSGLEHRHQTPWIVGPDAKHPIVRQLQLDGVASPHVVHPAVRDPSNAPPVPPGVSYL